MSKIYIYLIILLFAVMSTGCANRGQLSDLPTFSHQKNPIDKATPSIKVIYTGTAGVLLQIDQHAIMLDPYFSNKPASFFKIFTSRPSADQQIVDALLPDISNISGILIGHAHVDHLLDAPYILSKAPEKTKIYGSETMSNIIAAVVEESRRVALNDSMATQDVIGEWVTLPDPHIRFMPIQSEHAPQLGPILLGGGQVKSEQKHIPKGIGWKAGQPLTYLVDFLKSPLQEGESPNIMYRVFLQSSASGPGYGVPPQTVLNERSVDLALLCVASFKNVKQYPEHTLNAIQPNKVVLLHWDNIFKSRLEHDVELLSTLSTKDIIEFIERAKIAIGEQGEVLMPMPGTEFILPLSLDTE